MKTSTEEWITSVLARIQTVSDIHLTTKAHKVLIELPILKDSHTGEVLINGSTLCTMTVSQRILDEQDEQALFNLTRLGIHQIILHEVDENLKVDGLARWDPHALPPPEVVPVPPRKHWWRR